MVSFYSKTWIWTQVQSLTSCVSIETWLNFHETIFAGYLPHEVVLSVEIVYIYNV